MNNQYGKALVYTVRDLKYLARNFQWAES